MAIGNGYLGIRSTTEETYAGEVRNMFVAGAYNKFDESEVNELANVADLIQMNISINNERFSLEKGELKAYRRYLNLKTGELVRTILWTSQWGEEYQLTFRRFASLENIHLVGTMVEIIPLTGEATIEIDSGINGQQTNSGAQNFHEGEKQVIDRRFLEMVQITTRSKVDIVSHSAHRFTVDGEEIHAPILHLDRRYVHITQEVKVPSNSVLRIEKLSNVYTSRDIAFDYEGYLLNDLKRTGLNNLKQAFEKGYETCFEESVVAGRNGGRRWI